MSKHDFQDNYTSFLGYIMSGSITRTSPRGHGWHRRQFASPHLIRTETHTRKFPGRDLRAQESGMLVWTVLIVPRHYRPASILPWCTPERSQGCTATRSAISRIAILAISVYVTPELDRAGAFIGVRRS